MRTGGLILLVCFALLNVVSAKVVIVATTGSDASGNGTISNPFASIYRAVKSVSPGDFIQLRGGVYNGTGPGFLVINGAPNSFITIEPYSGERPIIDGTYVNVTFYSALFSLYSSSYVNITSLEIRNSTGGGFLCYLCNNTIYYKNFIHDVLGAGFVGHGDYITFESNEVANAAMNNSLGRGGGWPGIVMSNRKADKSRSSYWTVKNNYVHDSWGEGIIADFNYGVVQGNIVKNTYSVNIYLDAGLGASNLLVDSNIVIATNNSYNKLTNGAPAYGIMLSTEPYNVPTFPVENVIISNNLCLRNVVGFKYWHDAFNTNTTSNTYRNISFFHNVIWHPTYKAIDIDTVPSGFDQPSLGRIWNNIISNGTVSIGNANVWTFSHNNFVSGVPAVANETNSFSMDPGFIEPSEAGGVAGFKLSAASALLHKGAPTVVTTDFWGTKRNPLSPTIGLYEPLETTTTTTTTASATTTTTPSTSTTAGQFSTTSTSSSPVTTTTAGAALVYLPTVLVAGLSLLVLLLI